jgi:hypothetical protein
VKVLNKTKGVILSLGVMVSMAAAETVIKHKQVDYVEPEKRFGLSASITDESGVNRARAYFKAKDSADFVFVDMSCKAVEKTSTCVGVLPSPSKEAKEIEYVFLVENGNKEVAKSQTFSAPVMSEEEVPAWKKAKQALDTASDVKDALKVAEKILKINSEAANVTQSISGFADKVVVQAVELKQKLGVVTGLTSSSSAGTTASSVSSASGTTSAGTVTATSGVATSTVVAVGAGVAVAGAATSGGDDGGSSASISRGIVMVFNNYPKSVCDSAKDSYTTTDYATVEYGESTKNCSSYGLTCNHSTTIVAGSDYSSAASAWSSGLDSWDGQGTYCTTVTYDWGSYASAAESMWGTEFGTCSLVFDFSNYSE